MAMDSNEVLPTPSLLVRSRNFIGRLATNPATIGVVFTGGVQFLVPGAERLITPENAHLWAGGAAWITSVTQQFFNKELPPNSSDRLKIVAPMLIRAIPYGLGAALITKVINLPNVNEILVGATDSALAAAKSAAGHAWTSTSEAVTTYLEQHPFHWPESGPPAYTTDPQGALTEPISPAAPWETACGTGLLIGAATAAAAFRAQIWKNET